MTTSLRGLLDTILRVEVLTRGCTRGSAGGVVPSSFRILRQLLDRIEDDHTGQLLLRELHADIPEDRLASSPPPPTSWATSPPVPVRGRDPTGRPTTEQLLIARTWDRRSRWSASRGAPAGRGAGNVLPPSTGGEAVLRRCPTTSTPARAARLERRSRPTRPTAPRARDAATQAGWHAPPRAPWLTRALDGACGPRSASRRRSMGEGGTIPFMGMLGHRFPQAQFVVTGVLGPAPNAHGPNEFLHLPTARRITAASPTCSMPTPVAEPAADPPGGAPTAWPRPAGGTTTGDVCGGPAPGRRRLPHVFHLPADRRYPGASPPDGPDLASSVPKSADHQSTRPGRCGTARSPAPTGPRPRPAPAPRCGWTAAAQQPRRHRLQPQAVPADSEPRPPRLL